MKKILFVMLLFVLIAVPVFTAVSSDSGVSLLFHGKGIAELTNEEVNAELLARILMNETGSKQIQLQDQFMKEILDSARGKLSTRDYVHALKIVGLLKAKLMSESFGNRQSKIHLKRVRELENFEKQLKKNYVAIDGPLSNFENKIENGLGQAMWESMVQDNAAGNDAQKARVEGLAGKLFEVSKKERDFGEYKVAVIDMKVEGQSIPNALCLPGGYFFVTTALLDALGEDDSALSFVIGHECGHHISKDSIQKLKLMIPLLPLKLISKKLVARFIEAPMSRNDEYKADRKGCELTKKIGLDPKGGITMMNKFTELFGDHPAGPYGTHPSNSDRVKNIEAWIEKNSR